MICNKKEWETLDEVQALLSKMSKYMTETDKEKANEFIYLCYKSTQEEKARRAKTAERIAEKRKDNPDYARPQREFRKK
jgi:hypothetical protein